jgi:hypothetical protein
VHDLCALYRVFRQRCNQVAARRSNDVRPNRVLERSRRLIVALRVIKNIDAIRIDNEYFRARSGARSNDLVDVDILTEDQI